MKTTKILSRTILIDATQAEHMRTSQSSGRIFGLDAAGIKLLSDQYVRYRPSWRVRNGSATTDSEQELGITIDRQRLCQFGSKICYFDWLIEI
jgi:hypothetical protein